MIRHQGDNLEEPLNIDAIMPDDFKGFLIFDRWNGVNPSSEMVDEIGDDEYGLPKYYTVSDPDSGAAEIPVTKLFGRSPSGLNATGESDLQNYYDMVGEKQESILRPILNKLLPIVCVSVFGAVPEDFDFEFEPVAEPSDEERTELAKSGTDNVVAAFNAGLISQRTALMEMKQQSNRTGIWTNITDEDIEKADAEVQQEGDMPGMPGMPGADNTTPDNNIDKMPVKTHATDADFNEADHVRKPNGQFAQKGGGGAAGKNDLKNSGKNGNIKRRKKADARGANQLRVKDFADDDHRSTHYGGGGDHDHKKQYPGWTQEQYLARAVWLAEQPCTSGGIRGYRRRGCSTVIVRYDPKTNDFVVADINTGIYSMFKPTKGKFYFEDKLKMEGETQ